MSCWELALSYCPPSAPIQKQQLWNALLPCALLIGRLPTSVPEDNPFKSVLSAYRVGDLKSWLEWMNVHESHWIEKGQFLTVERLTMYVWRNLLRRMYVYE